eukprot:913266_1
MSSTGSMHPFKVLKMGHNDLQKDAALSQQIVNLYKMSFDKKMWIGNASLSNELFLDECLSFFDACDVEWWMLSVQDELVSAGISVLMLKEYFIYNLCTHPRHRRNGYAKYLLFEIKSYALKHSIIGFKGNVDLQNIGAITFYTKYGAYQDREFACSSGPDNKPTYMRLLYRWNEQDQCDVRNEIECQQNNVLSAFQWKQKRTKQIKQGIAIMAVLSIAYFLYKKYQNRDQNKKQ